MRPGKLGVTRMVLLWGYAAIGGGCLVHTSSEYTESFVSSSGD